MGHVAHTDESRHTIDFIVSQVDEPSDSGWTAMMWAARGGHPEVCDVTHSRV